MRDWIAGLDAATGKRLWRKYTIPAPGEPGSETWKGNNNAWQTGGAAVWVTGTYDPESNQTVWGTGNPVPMFDPTYRPGDNLFTNSAISWNPDTGAMNWYFQFTPGDMWDYDEVGTHIMIDGVIAGQPRKLITHSGRNGFFYTMERANGAMVSAKPFMDKINWTKGIDQKTGKPIDYDPNKDIQTYSTLANQNPSQPTRQVCPSIAGGNNYWPSSYSPRTRLTYIPAMTACSDVTLDTARHSKERGFTGGVYRTADRYESNLTAIDPLNGEIKKTVHLQYPNYSGTVATGGGLVFLRAPGRHRRGIRRHHARPVVEGQCRLRLLGTPDDLRGERQAVCRDRIGAERLRQSQARQHAGAQGPAPGDRAVRVRAVSATLAGWRFRASRMRAR